MRLLLWALAVPTNVEKSVRELRLKLFQEWGLVSALALPETVPLVFLPGEAPHPSPHRLPGRLAAPQLSTGGLRTVGDCLYWEVEPPERVEEIAQLCRRLTPPESLQEPFPQEPFPPQPGFFLARYEGREQITEIAARLAVPDAHTFTALQLALLKIQTSGGEGGARWWESLAWQEIVSVPLRRGSQGG